MGSTEAIRYLTIDELSEKIQVPKSTIYQWKSARKIPFHKFGSHLRFDLFEVVEHFRSEQDSPAPCDGWDKYVDSDPRSLKIGEVDRPENQ